MLTLIIFAITLFGILHHFCARLIFLSTSEILTKCFLFAKINANKI